MSHCYFAVNIHGVFVVQLERENLPRTKFTGRIEITSFSVMNNLPTSLPNFFPDKKSSFLQLPFVSSFLPNYQPNETTFHLLHSSASQTLYSDLKCCQMLYKALALPLYTIALTLTITFPSSAPPLTWFFITCSFFSLVKNTLKAFLNHIKYQFISLISLNVSILHPLRFFFKYQLVSSKHHSGIWSYSWNPHNVIIYYNKNLN